ncbi:MAG: hypothetical protein OEX07_11750 [Gammaproteobacteria bacterium]|nr:hypothetical protein [Gammaproteobacteria bacterium]
MLKWLSYFWRLSILKASPDHAPAAKSVLHLTVFVYWGLAALFASFSQSLFESFFLALVQTAILMFFTNLSLWIRQYPERASQTLTAVFGAGSIILLASIFLSSNISISIGQSPNILFSLLLVFLVWTVIVYANIFKVSLSIPYFAGLGIALIFVYLSFSITWRFLKIISISQI